MKTCKAPKINQQGQGMVGLLVSSSLLLLMFGAVFQLLDNMYAVQKGVSVSAEFADYMVELTQMTSDRASCKAAFAGQVVYSSTFTACDTTGGNTTTVTWEGRNYLKLNATQKGLTATKLCINRIDDSWTLGDPKSLPVKLIVELSKADSVGGRQNYQQEFGFNVVTDGASPAHVVDCIDSVRSTPVPTTVIRELDSSWTPSWANIVAYFKLNGTAGTTVANLSVATATVGANGVYHSDVPSLTYAAGVPGGVPPFSTDQSASFTGVDQTYVQVASLDVNLFNTISFSSWVNIPLAAIGANNPIVCATNVGDWCFSIVAGKLVMSNASGGLQSTSTGAITSGVWHFVVVTLSGGTLNFYIDGALDSSPGWGGGWTRGGGFYRLGSDLQGGHTFTGMMQDPSYWDGSAIDAVEVAALYNGGVGGRSFDIDNLYVETLTNEWLFSGAVGAAILPGTDIVDNASGSNDGRAFSRTYITFQNAQLNQGVSIPASSASYVAMGFSTSPATYTLAAWIYLMAYPTDPNSPAILLSNAMKYPSTFGPGIDVHLDSSHYLYVDHHTALAQWCYKSNFADVIPLNTWAHVAVTFHQNTTNGIGHVLYVNGVAISAWTPGTSAACAVGPMPVPTDGGYNWNIGISGDAVGPSTSAIIDEVAIWNVDLSVSDIATIYNHQK